MTDDIVARLRLWASAVPEKDPVIEELHRAADEIERLKAELEITVKWRDSFKFAFEKEQQNAKHWHDLALGNKNE